MSDNSNPPAVVPDIVLGGLLWHRTWQVIQQLPNLAGLLILAGALWNIQENNAARADRQLDLLVQCQRDLASQIVPSAHFPSPDPLQELLGIP